jgi:gamma-glutamylputrescine oxidase
MNVSYWEHDVFFRDLDAIIVGAGIVGLSTAIHLRKAMPNARIAVVERDFFSAGASSKNAGFACFGSVGELLDDLVSMSEDEVFSLVERRYKGLLLLRSMIGDHALEYIPCGGTEVFTDKETKEAVRCIDAIGYMNNRVKTITGLDTTYSIGFAENHTPPFQRIHSAIHNRAEGIIHTGRMLHELWKKAQSENILVLHGVNVHSINESSITVDGRFLHARAIAVCTNGFARQLLPQFDVRPARNQVLVTSPIADLDWRGAFHADKGYIYFRSIGTRVLIGGFRNTDMKNESTSEFGLTPFIQDQLTSYLKEFVLPGKNWHVEHGWSGILGLGPNKTIIVQKVQDGLYCGVRMGGMGVAIGSLVGSELAALIASDLR